MDDRKKPLPDRAARFSALTELDRSLLVEAGAGSGKTSIMAGRVAMLFARGVEPKHIAAITFTEFAASELMSRISRFVTALADGKIPEDLEIAFPQGISPAQRKNLHRANNLIDQLVCTTIHGFAQSVIKPYPVEAGIDPGAEIIDPVEGDLAFAEIYDAWIRERLSGEAGDDIVAELVLADEDGGLALIREVANFRRRNRDACPGSIDWSATLVETFTKATANFSAELVRMEFQEEETGSRAQRFGDLGQTIAGLARDATAPCRGLVGILNLTNPSACFTQAGGARQLKTLGRWQTAAAAAGRPKAAGTEAHQGAKSRYDACHDAFAALRTQTAAEVLARIARSMDGLIANWQAWKRDAALLDFDDLLYTARDLVREHEAVRQALAGRFRHVLVDEFQDTDPLQIDLLWRLCGESVDEADASPLKRALRPGALFLVGDPKQAIYRFRGADVNAYISARDAIGADALLKITANFRSVEPILTFVNTAFETPLSMALGQPGFTELAATRSAEPKTLAVAALDIATEDDAKASDKRDAEADRIAELCRRLVGNRLVRDREGALRPARLGDIALLAPVGTELWRFEEALENCGIAVSTQAGKGFFRRQEIKDLIALTRTLADGRDTLALGALLRGPLVGLTEAELLEIAEGLPADPHQPDRLPQLNLWTDPDEIRHELASGLIRSLQSLALRARSTTPYALLSDAVGILNVRAQLQRRFKAGADRAQANIDVFLDMSRAYDVRGLRAFARDMRANWEDAVRQVEGRPDAEEQSVALITIHASKGLEWPIVIPINMTGRPKSDSGLMHDRRADLFSIPVLGIAPEDYADIQDRNAEELERERVRLWYVAATRARDLLVMPRHSPDLPNGAWAKLVEFDSPSLPAIDPEEVGDPMPSPALPQENPQSREIFAGEAKRIVESHRKIEWRQPSRSEMGEAAELRREPVFATAESLEEFQDTRQPIAGSATRGTLLHKLIEEVLNLETADDAPALIARAKELLAQLTIAPSETAKNGISPDEIAATVVRTLNLPEIAEMRPRLVPELVVLASHQGDHREIIVSGITDAVAYDSEGQIEAIIDWKSDVEVDAARLASYRGQIECYRQETGAKRAFLVLMTQGKVMSG
ncbi:UvrD-helicase domain-containing protein [Methylocella tundrae]|nr:UvrD-helicase domain-containing protein [Methylocella tundrae]